MKKEKITDINKKTYEVKAKKKKDKGDGSVSFLVLKIAIALIVALIVVYFGFTCEVRESNAAIILRFGAPRAEITEAGLYFKLPWPFETVVTYDNRVQYLESNNHETTTMDKKNIILQSYATWEIKDPLTYHNTVGAKGTVDSYIKDQIKLQHILRLQKSECTIEHGFVLSDILTNLERVADHCSNVGSCLIEMSRHESLDLHNYLNEVTADNAEFKIMYKGYRAKYCIEAMPEE